MVDMKVHEISPDGNCMFRSVAYLIHGTDEKHEEVREACVTHLTSNKNEYYLHEEGNN
jgi:hypothetical protein